MTTITPNRVRPVYGPTVRHTELRTACGVQWTHTDTLGKVWQQILGEDG